MVSKPEIVNRLIHEEMLACIDCVHPEVEGYCEEICKLGEVYQVVRDLVEMYYNEYVTNIKEQNS